MNNNEKKALGRPKTVQKQRATELAMEMYWQDGLHSYSLNEICRRVKLSKPSLYREFKNEDGLMEAALMLYRTVVIEPMLELRNLALPFNEVLEYAIVQLTSDRNQPAGCLFTQMRLAKPYLGPFTLKCLEKIEKERVDAFEEWYSKALKEGEVNAKVSPQLAARYIDTQFTALLLQMGSNAHPDIVREQTRLAFTVLLRL